MAENHPIESLMQTAMESLKSMVDVNTVVGDPVETPDGTVIIPVSRVSCGFAAGGSEFQGENGSGGGEKQGFPFGGGSGGGISVQPMGFLVVKDDKVRLLPVDNNAIYDRLIDLAPQVIDQIKSMMNSTQGNSGMKERTKQPSSLQGGV